MGKPPACRRRRLRRSLDRTDRAWGASCAGVATQTMDANGFAPLESMTSPSYQQNRHGPELFDYPSR